VKNAVSVRPEVTEGIVVVIVVPTDDPVYTVTPSSLIHATYLLTLGLNAKVGLLPVVTLTAWPFETGVDGISVTSPSPLGDQLTVTVFVEEGVVAVGVGVAVVDVEVVVAVGVGVEVVIVVVVVVGVVAFVGVAVGVAVAVIVADKIGPFTKVSPAIRTPE
jgi:hypothetical protein